METSISRSRNWFQKRETYCIFDAQSIQNVLMVSCQFGFDFHGTLLSFSLQNVTS